MSMILDRRIEIVVGYVSAIIDILWPLLEIVYHRLMLGVDRI